MHNHHCSLKKLNSYNYSRVISWTSVPVGWIFNLSIVEHFQIILLIYSASFNLSQRSLVHKVKTSFTPYFLHIVGFHFCKNDMPWSLQKFTHLQKSLKVNFTRLHLSRSLGQETNTNNKLGEPVAKRFKLWTLVWVRDKIDNQI